MPLLITSARKKILDKYLKDFKSESGPDIARRIAKDKTLSEFKDLTFKSICQGVQKYRRSQGLTPAKDYSIPEGRVTKNNANTAKVLNEPEELKHRIKDHIKKKEETQTLAALSDHFDVGVSKIIVAIKQLEKEGHTVKINGDAVVFSKIIPKADARVLSVKKMSTGFYKFGVLGDTHLGSRYERLDVLNALYDKFEQEGITTVYHTGNYIDGEARFNKHDLLVHGLDGQIEYFLDKYPQRKGITTYYITGDDHEGWYTQREGIDVGAYTHMRAKKRGRTDLVYLGHMEADVILKAKEGQTIIRVLHPGGGSSYAISYTSQKIVESYTGGEKPDVLFDGHYHKAGYNFIRGVHVIQTGCTQDQTPFMRKKRLAAHLGGWIIEIATDDIGAVTQFKQEFIPFFDNAYYEKWAYKWK